MSTETQQRPDANDEGISERRRQMLRAAATAAPLVATLPSSAALANASAFQCVEADKAATDAGEFDSVYLRNETALVTVPAYVKTGTKRFSFIGAPPADSAGMSIRQSWTTGSSVATRESTVDNADSVASSQRGSLDTLDTPPADGRGLVRRKAWVSGGSVSTRALTGGNSTLESTGANLAKGYTFEKAVSVYRLGDGDPYEYYEYLDNEESPSLNAADGRTAAVNEGGQLRKSDASPSPDRDDRYQLVGEWAPVNLVRVYDVGHHPPYTYANEDCGSEPCLLMAHQPTAGTQFTALNGSCLASVAVHEVNRA